VGKKWHQANSDKGANNEYVSQSQLRPLCLSFVDILYFTAIVATDSVNTSISPAFSFRRKHFDDKPHAAA
jgi:hypothetical protein